MSDDKTKAAFDTGDIVRLGSDTKDDGPALIIVGFECPEDDPENLHAVCCYFDKSNVIHKQAIPVKALKAYLTQAPL
ncbi:MAG: hypothetical protein HYV60_19455 [Planctomycetia bacterium]|nr:hypothetical protein [Planctomycetia bacterium]